MRKFLLILLNLLDAGCPLPQQGPANDLPVLGRTLREGFFSGGVASGPVRLDRARGLNDNRLVLFVGLLHRWLISLVFGPVRRLGRHRLVPLRVHLAQRVDRGWSHL